MTTGPHESTAARLLANAPALLLGLLAVGVATLAGWNPQVAALLLAPPLPARIMLGSVAVVAGVLTLLAAADRLGTSREPRDLIRGIRLVFLAVAAGSAAAGWFLGSAVPVIAGLVIAGIDILETTLLLLVTAVRDADLR
jgi:hypothetical protein